MPQCSHYITLELQCNIDSLEGQERCPKHHAQHVRKETQAGPIRQGGCRAICSNGKRCQTFANEGQPTCTRHANCEARAEMARNRLRQEDATIADRTQVFLDGAMEWRLCIQLLLGEWRENTITSRVFWQVSRKVTEAQGSTIDEMDEFYNTIRFMQILPYQQPAARPVGELQRLAEDSQNVHTKEVSEQTEKLTNLLLAHPVPEGQRTLQLLTIKFSKLCRIDRMSQLLTTLSDINLWYEKSSCIKEGDALYRHLLNAVVSKIEASTSKAGLYRRAYEETSESVGLCCQGHLSRLINIFSGFDSEFSSPVSNREMLQDKIAHIASSQSSVEEKIRHATDVLIELSIAKEEWADWIGAL